MTSKLIGGTMPGSQMRKQRVREARALSRGHTGVRQPGVQDSDPTRRSLGLAPTPPRLARPEPGSVGAPGVGAGDAADPAGLKQHPFNKYLSQTPEGPGRFLPLPRSLLMRWDPPEGLGAAGTGRWAGICCGVWPEAEVSPVSRGAQGWGLALQHLHWVTQRRLAGARCPACMLTLPPARANICGQEASSVSMSRAQVATGSPLGRLLPLCFLEPARALRDQPAGHGSSACTHSQAGGGWAPLPEPPGRSCTRTSPGAPFLATQAGRRVAFLPHYRWGN